MIGPLMKGLCSVLGAALVLASCSTLGEGERPAVFAEGTDMDSVKAQLSSALGRGTIELGSSDPTETPQLVVLPPRLAPLETRSTAVPLVLDIVLTAQGCGLKRRDDETLIMLGEVRCKPA